VLLALLAVLAVVDGGSALLHVDRPVQLWVLDRREGWASSLARAATELGAPASAFVAGLLLAALAGRRSPAIGLGLLSLTLVRPLVSAGLKAAIDRDRPAVGALVSASGQSLPSGHTLAAAVLAGSALLAAAAYRPRIAPAWSAVAAAPVALVGATRVYLGVHWLSDVVAGALVGGLLLALVWMLLIRGGFGSPPVRPASLPSPP